MNDTEKLITIAAMAAGTLITRYLPFIFFPEGRKIPKFVIYLGKVLPYAVISFLTVYCLRNVSLTKAPYALPEAVSIVCIIILHLWRKNTLLSIGAGTAIYMILVQYIF